MNNNELYFYSTIAQSIAALYAVGGIFIVYRYQTIDQQIGHAYEALINFIKSKIIKWNLRPHPLVRKPYPPDKYHLNKDPDLWLHKDIISHLRVLIFCENRYIKWCSEKNVEPHGNIMLLNALIDYYLQITVLKKFKRKLRRYLFYVFTSLIFLFFLSITRLSNIPFSLKFFDSTTITIVITAFLIIVLTCFINFSLKDPNIPKINNPETNIPDLPKDLESKVNEIVDSVLSDNKTSISYNTFNLCQFLKELFSEENN